MNSPPSAARCGTSAAPTPPPPWRSCAPPGVAASAYGNRLHLFAREDELHARAPLLGADARCQLRPVSMEGVFVRRVTALEAEKPA
ncbi:MAG: hypothetical protein U1E47_02465 [Rivihabitans pingtungensis]